MHLFTQGRVYLHLEHAARHAMLGCGLWSLLLVDEQLTQPAAAAAGAGAPSDRDTSVPGTPGICSNAQQALLQFACTGARESAATPRYDGICGSHQWRASCTWRRASATPSCCRSASWRRGRPGCHSRWRGQAAPCAAGFGARALVALQHPARSVLSSLPPGLHRRRQ